MQRPLHTEPNVANQKVFESARSNLSDHLLKKADDAAKVQPAVDEVCEVAHAFVSGGLYHSSRDDLSPYRDELADYLEHLTRRSRKRFRLSKPLREAMELSLQGLENCAALAAGQALVGRVDIEPATREQKIVAARSLLSEIESKRGAPTDDAVRALYLRFAPIYSRCTGRRPRGWKQCRGGGRPKVFVLLHDLVEAIDPKAAAQVTPKKFYRAMAALYAPSVPPE